MSQIVQRGQAYYYYYYSPTQKERVKLKDKKTGTTRTVLRKKYMGFKLEAKTKLEAAKEAAAWDEHFLFIAKMPELVNKIVKSAVSIDELMRIAKQQEDDRVARLKENQLSDLARIKFSNDTITIDGRPIPEVLREAEQIVYEKNPTLSELWPKWVAWAKDGNRSRNTIITYTTAYKHLEAFFTPTKRINDIDKAATAQLYAWLKNEKKVHEKGILSYMTYYQGIWTTSKKLEWIDASNPWKSPLTALKSKFNSQPQRIGYHLTKEEVDRVLVEAKKLSPKLHLVIALGCHAGLRKDECSNIRWENITFKRNAEGKETGWINLVSHEADEKKGIVQFTLKSKQMRTIPLRQELSDILYPIRKLEGYVIEGSFNRFRFRASSLEKLKEICNLPQFTIHTCRHTYCSLLAQQNISILKIQKWAGHHSPELTSSVYSHLQPFDEDCNSF